MNMTESSVDIVPLYVVTIILQSFQKLADNSPFG